MLMMLLTLRNSSLMGGLEFTLWWRKVQPSGILVYGRRNIRSNGSVKRRRTPPIQKKYRAHKMDEVGKYHNRKEAAKRYSQTAPGWLLHQHDSPFGSNLPI
jgi:hypothetical protein